jgi:hypothetical protein
MNEVFDDVFESKYILFYVIKKGSKFLKKLIEGSLSIQHS